MKPLLREFKRRNVYKITVVYVVASWLLLQVADTLFPAFDMPEIAMRVLAIVLFFSFPLVLLFTWAFELTPEGVRKTHPAHGDELVRITNWDYVVTVLLLVLITMMLVQTCEAKRPLTGEIVESGDVNPTQRTQTTDSIATSEPVPSFSNRAAIAVLPFLNMSNDPEQEYFADGITEDLITGLQSFRSFPIIARTSTFKYKNAAIDLREVANALGAGYIIEGSVRRVCLLYTSPSPRD